MKNLPWLISLALVATLATHARGEDEFEAHVYKGEQGKTLPYRLLTPANYDKAKHYPILLFLHGYGERGTDNKAQLKHCVDEFVKPGMREKYPCFVLVPQAPDAWIGIADADFQKPLPASRKPEEALMLAMETLDALAREYSIDSHRVYLSGASNGGYAVWWLLEHEHQRFAAAVPMCGGGDPSAISIAKSVPIWAFHGEKDPVVPVERSREMVAALKAAGGDPKFTEYPKGKHMDSADKAFKSQEMFEWMFEQKK